MPSKKKKTKSKQANSKTSTSKQPNKASRRKRMMAPKKSVKKKQAKKKTAPKVSPVVSTEKLGHGVQRLESSWGRKDARSSRQSGDLAGLSRVQQADSESVGELVEEGNVPEAGAVAGVEEADDQETREVHTHEVAEDDVPDEYLDKD